MAGTHPFQGADAELPLLCQILGSLDTLSGLQPGLGRLHLDVTHSELVCEDRHLALQSLHLTADAALRWQTPTHFDNKKF